MKLKKIASLALAGVMAVSVLAGCGTDKGGNTANDGANTSVASIVDAINNGQSVKNKVKVTFTYNTDLETAAKKAAALYQDGSNTTKLADAILQYMPSLMDDVLASNDKFYGNEGVKIAGVDITENSTKDDDGDKVTTFMVSNIGTSPASEEYVLNAAAASVDAILSVMDDTNKVVPGETGKTLTKEGEHYQDYSYTGSVCKFEIQNTNGTTEYYLGVVLTQTVTDHVLEK